MVGVEVEVAGLLDVGVDAIVDRHVEGNFGIRRILDVGVVIGTACGTHAERRRDRASRAAIRRPVERGAPTAASSTRARRSARARGFRTRAGPQLAARSASPSERRRRPAGACRVFTTATPLRLGAATCSSRCDLPRRALALVRRARPWSVTRGRPARSRRPRRQPHHRPRLASSRRCGHSGHEPDRRSRRRLDPLSRRFAAPHFAPDQLSWTPRSVRFDGTRRPRRSGGDRPRRPRRWFDERLPDRDEPSSTGSMAETSRVDRGAG